MGAAMAQESFLEAAALQDGRIKAKIQIKAKACLEEPSDWRCGLLQSDIKLQNDQEQNAKGFRILG